MSTRRWILTVFLSCTIFSTANVQGKAHGDEAMPLLQARIENLPAEAVVIELTRITLAPGAGLDVVVPGPELYAVESGTLGLRVEEQAQLNRGTEGGPATPEAAMPGVDYVLRPGDQAMVPAGVSQRLLNDGQETAEVLNLVIFPASSAIPSWLPEAERPPGVTVAPLASTVPDKGNWPSGPALVTVTRVNVAAGDDIPPPMIGAFTMLVVEQGTLRVAVDGAAEVEHGPGGVAQLEPGTSGATLNAGDTPLTALILTIDEALPEAGTPPSEASPAAANTFERDGLQSGTYR